ncbi:MAG TPA: hypothetical protein VL017_10450 [Devosia sp.]|nr:hypothetical protein [Devosia sp.]
MALITGSVVAFGLTLAPIGLRFDWAVGRTRAVHAALTFWRHALAALTNAGCCRPQTNASMDHAPSRQCGNSERAFR